jgi:hypothetical protein
MSCCGKQRQSQITPVPMPNIHRASTVYFRYLGEQGITVTSPISGRRYEFPASNATLAVDPRDAHSLAAVPHMIQVRIPY